MRRTGWRSRRSEEPRRLAGYLRFAAATTSRGISIMPGSRSSKATNSESRSFLPPRCADRRQTAAGPREGRLASILRWIERSRRATIAALRANPMAISSSVSRLFSWPSAFHRLSGRALRAAFLLRDILACELARSRDPTGINQFRSLPRRSASGTRAETHGECGGWLGL